MGKYLVTGAAGFIASKVCAMLLQEGHSVIGIDNLNDYYDPKMKEYRLRALSDMSLALANVTTSNQARSAPEERFSFHLMDIEDLSALSALFTAHRFDAVFNLAARAGVRASMSNPYVFLSTNTEGTLNILECQRRFGVKKQILASTSSLYAGCPMPFTESQPVNTPLSPYAAAKKAAELMAYSYHKLYGLDISVLRYFTVYGPAGRPDMAPFRFIEWTRRGTPIQMFGDGSQSRDFTYVDDIARGTIAAKRELGYEIINLGGGTAPRSLLDILHGIEETLGRKARIEQSAFHVADVRATWADISKAKALLNWAPQVGPDQGFKRTITWHLENTQLLQSITF